MILHVVEFVLRIIVNTISIVDLIIYHTLVVTRNASKLYSFLIRGTKTWIVMFGRLMMFTCILGIGWYRLLKYWIFSPLILRNVEYGQGGKFRNLMDIYLPVPHNPHMNSNQNKTQVNPGDKANSVPIVIFVSGGAWIIGYKLWSALVARGLSHLGLVCVVPDYRNFPQGDVEDMMADIRAAIQWTTFNASRFGGDSNKIVLAGQSAGAHICTCLLVDDFLRAHNKHRYYTVIPQAEPLAPGGTVMGIESCVIPVVLSPSNNNSGDNNGVSSTLSGESLEGANISTDSLVGQSIEIITSTVKGDTKPPLHKQTAVHSGSHTSGDDQDALRINIPVSLNNGYVMASGTPPKAPVSATNESAADSAPDHHFNASEHIKLFIGVSGPYNLNALVSHLQHRGLDPSILQYICKGDVIKYSPTIQLLEFCALRVRELLGAQQTVGASSSSVESSNVDGSASDQERSDEDGVYVSESNRASPVAAALVDEEVHCLRCTVPAGSPVVGSKSAPRLLPVGRPFYAYYLPQVHSFFALSDEEGPDGAIDNTTNTPLPSDGNLRRRINKQKPELAAQPRPVEAVQPTNHLSAFPPVALFHGSKDKSIPVDNCTDLFDALRANGATVDMKIYNHWSHTDAIVEAPLSGNMRLFYDMVDCVETYTNLGGSSPSDSDGDTTPLTNRLEEVQANCSDKPTQHGHLPLSSTQSTRARRDSDWYHEDGRSSKDDNRRQKLDVMVPRVLVNMARKVNPF